MALKLKQKAFARKYLENGGNATLAAMDVYNTKNKNSAGVIGSKLLRNAKVKQALGEVSERSLITNEYILEKLKEVTEAGIGIKAKNSDSLNGLALMSKINGMQQPQKTAHLRIELKEELENKSYDEIVNMVKELQANTERLLSLTR